MTFKEKLAMEHPDQIRSDCEGGCVGCPGDYHYDIERCTDPDGNCERCWNREIPGTEKPEEQLASELKSCPFCGDEATLVKDRASDGNCSYKIAYVKCNSCGCRSAAFIVDGYYAARTTVRDAIKSWNRRVAK